MTGQELARKLTKLVDWTEDVQENGDRDSEGNYVHVSASYLLEEVIAQTGRLAREAQGLPSLPRTPLVYRASELDA